MSNYRRPARLAAIVAVGAIALAACGGGDDDDAGTGGTGGTTEPAASGHEFNVSTEKIINPSDATGGTLRLGASSDCDSWDPARAYYGWCWNMQRLYARTLMTFDADPTTASEVVPDLAEAAGEPNEDFTQFTYHLKEGVTFEDGTPITSQDIKYAVQRIYATDVISGGPTGYLHPLLDQGSFDTGTPTYKGPYAEPDSEPMVNGAPAIETPDDRTIVFNLTTPYATFDYLLAMGTTSPIPQDKDTGEQYTTEPISSGPFMITDYNRDTGITFERNPNWDQATDDVRTPKVDTITIDYFTNPDDLDQRLKAGTLDAGADTTVQPTFSAEAFADPELMAHIDNPFVGLTRYLVAFQTVAPFDDVHCRRAVAYAIDKRAFLLSRGGENQGDPTGTMAHVGLPGYDPAANMYPNGDDSTGDLAKAQEELEACGQPDGFTTKLAYVPVGTGDAQFAALQESLARVNINVEPAQGEQETYFNTFIGSPQGVVDNGLGLAIAGWGADFPTSNGFWYSIAHGKAILPQGNSNYAELDDPTVNGLLDGELSATPEEWESIGRQIDDAVMETAVYIPLIAGKSVYWRNDRLTNVYSTTFFGLYDWVNIGVSDGQ